MNKPVKTAVKAASARTLAPADQVARYVDAVQTLAAIAAKREAVQAQGKAAAQAVTAAAKEENYEKAATLKTARDAAQAELGLLREQQDKASKALAKHFTDASLGYFQLHPASISKKEFTRVIVADPLTHQTDEAVYDDGCDRLRLEVGSHHFDNEAYRLKDWAKERGLLVHTQTASLEFSQ